MLDLIDNSMNSVDSISKRATGEAIVKQASWKILQVTVVTKYGNDW